MHLARLRQLFAGLVVVAALLGTLPAFAQPGPAQVAVAPLVQRDVAAGQSFVGTVVPVRTSIVGGPIGGRVEEFAINEGDRVAKGQVLCKLRTKTIELELASAKAELEARKQELLELETGWRPEEIEQARARLAGSEALLKYRRARDARLKALLSTRGATQEEVQEATAAADQADHAFREAKAAFKVMEEGPRKEKIAQARAKMLAQQEEANRLQDQLDKHTIVAPFDGYIVAEHTEVGQWLNQGAAVAEVVELDQVDIEIPVLEDYIGGLRKGTPARVELGALAKDALIGEVVLVVPKANVRSRTFPVKVRVANQLVDGAPKLKAGMFARVTLQVGNLETALLVPKDALVLGGPSPMVYVVDVDGADASKGKARPVPVQLGVADDGLIQVKGDLKPGQQVVVVGNERLRPGQDVIVAKTAASKN
jgi:RND family efflux transporter MFP subunit